MKCENKFCVYWQEDACLLDEISLDSQGCCEECVYVNVEEEILNKKRTDFFQNIALE